MKWILPALFSLLALTATAVPKGGSVPKGGVLKSGPLPDLSAYTADGKPIQLRELCKGKYTVLKTGCLTCPEFHKSYSGVETAYADYAPKGVQFFYIYKSLRHPELNGYVQAQNISERLLQMEEARKKLGTQAPWLVDTMDDSIRIGLKSGSNSIYLVNPKGIIIWAASKMDEKGLRAALREAVGPVEHPTQVSELNLPNIQKQPKAINLDTDLLVSRPSGLNILTITPAKPEETYYVKLRAEADDALLNTGTGRLFLGFYPDPIHETHWNNLAPPMKYKLTLSKGMTAHPSEATAHKGPGETDTQPRQFWVHIEGAEKGAEMKLALYYFACAPGLCKALTHEYTIRLKYEDRGAATYGLNRGKRGGNRSGKGQQ